MTCRRHPLVATEWGWFVRPEGLLCRANTKGLTGQAHTILLADGGENRVY